MGIEVFKKHLREKRAISVITGNNNYDIENVAKICQAAQNAHASAINIACSKELYETARKNTKLPIFISSIHPFEILNAVQFGADGVIIGNFSAKYNSGKTFNAQEVYDITLEAMSLINKYDIYICASIPENLEIDEQLELTKKFEILGVDLIQINYSKNSNNKIQEIAQKTLAPVSLVANIDPKKINELFSYGIAGLEIELNNSSQIETMTNIMAFVSEISYRNSINKEIIRTKRELVLN